MPSTISKGILPPPKTLCSSLRKITETLARELASPTQNTPDWTELEWLLARAVAAMHGISPLLSRTLHWRGPDGWTRFIEGQRAHTAKRHARVEELLRRLDQRASAAGVAAVALKGAALHSMGLYAAGDRPMADIDLLVRPADADRTAQMLGSLGFHQVSETWKERVFNPADNHTPGALGEHSDNNIKIELHERIGERLPLRITDVTQCIFPAHSHPGLNGYPSKAALMVHLLLHAAGAMTFQALRLVQLHDIALLSAQMTNSDWQEILGRGPREPRLWWALPPLLLTSRYYSSKIPVRALTSLAGECSYLLGWSAKRSTVCDVSFSYLWVDAFPGIEWAQSVREIAQYVASRVRPDAGHVVQRGELANREAWASQSQWSRLSQGRRILRWITSCPTRPATMHAVRAALAQAP
jgi:hypothetical protein